MKTTNYGTAASDTAKATVCDAYFYDGLYYEPTKHTELFVGYGVKRRLKMGIEPLSLDSGSVILRVNQNKDKIRIWEKENEVFTQIMGKDCVDSQEWVITDTVDSIQSLKSLYIEGAEASEALNDVKLELIYEHDGQSIITNTFKVTVYDIQKLPLGGTANLSKFIIGQIYEPTQYGGTLTITTTTSSNIDLFYTDGSYLANDICDGIEYYIGTPPTWMTDIIYNQIASLGDTLPRIARLVAVGYPHHVIQRGNNR